VQTRRPAELKGDALCALDADAVARVRDEERPDPRDGDELHDALVCTGYLVAVEVNERLFDALAANARAARVTIASSLIVAAAERLPEILAIHPSARIEPPIIAPASRTARQWRREDALVELLRGRLAIAGPTTAKTLADSID